MSNIKQTYSFPNSGINSDLDLHVLPSGEAVSMINCEVGDYGNVGVLEKVKGNVKLELGLRNNDKIIGTFYSLLYESLFIFIYNTQKEHCILQYNPETKTINYVIQNNEYLDFASDDIVKDVEYIGDLMIFTTGRGSIKNINIKEAVAFTKGEFSTYETIGLNEININKPKPLISNLSIQYFSYFKDTYSTTNNHRVSGIRAYVAYKLIYSDGSSSELSEFSELISLKDVSFEGNYVRDYAKFTYTSNEHSLRIQFIVKGVNSPDLYLLKEEDIVKEGSNYVASCDFSSITGNIITVTNVVTGVKENVQNISIVENRLVICDYDMSENTFDGSISINDADFNKPLSLRPYNIGQDTHKINNEYITSYKSHILHVRIEDDSQDTTIIQDYNNPTGNNLRVLHKDYISTRKITRDVYINSLNIKFNVVFNEYWNFNEIVESNYRNIPNNHLVHKEYKYMPYNKYALYVSIGDDVIYDIPNKYISVEIGIPYFKDLDIFLKELYRSTFGKLYNNESINVKFYTYCDKGARGLTFIEERVLVNSQVTYNNIVNNNSSPFYIKEYYKNANIGSTSIVPNLGVLNGEGVGLWPNAIYQPIDESNPTVFEGFMYFEDYNFYINYFTKSGIYTGSNLIGASNFTIPAYENVIKTNNFLNTFLNKSVEFKISPNSSEYLYSIGYTRKTRYQLDMFQIKGKVSGNNLNLYVPSKTIDTSKPVFIRILSAEFAGQKGGVAITNMYQEIELDWLEVKDNNYIQINNILAFNSNNQYGMFIKHNAINFAVNVDWAEGEKEYKIHTYAETENRTICAFITGVIYNKENIETSPNVIKVCSELKPLATDSEIYVTPEYGAYVFKNYYKYIGGDNDIKLTYSDTVGDIVEYRSSINGSPYKTENRRKDKARDYIFNNGGCGFSSFTFIESIKNARLEIPLIDNSNNSENIYQRLLKNKNNIFWSDVYIPNTKVNGLNKFDYTDSKSLDTSYGDIVKIITTANSLKVVQWHKVSNIFAGRNEMINTNGDINLVSTDNILGSKSEYLENLGSKYSHSVVANGNNIYGVDSIAYSIWKVTGNGIDRLERYGINKLLKDIIKSGNIFDIISGYDSNKNLLYVTFIFEGGAYRTLQFNDQTKKWKEFTFNPTMYSYGGNILFTTYGSYVYEHGKGYKFYEKDYEASINIVANQNPNIVKTLDTISVASNKPIDIKNIELPKNARYIKGMKSRLPKSQFKNIEGKYHAAFLRNSIQTSNVETNKDLFNGDKLRGEYASIKIVLDDDTKLFSVEVNMTGSLPL